MAEEIKDNQSTAGDSPDLPAEDLLGQCQRERDEYLAGWQRAKADFLNYKKEESDRVSSLVKFANEELLEELVVVIDSFDLAILTMEKQGGLDQGIRLIRSQLLDIMRRRGLEKLTVTPGQPFDPQTSETISEVDSDLPAGTVVEEVKAGYALHGKLLRPAAVKISKGHQQENK